MFRSVLATILTAGLLTSSAAPSVSATPSTLGNTFEDHVHLVDTLSNAGVRVYFNPAVCAPEDGLNPSGFYVSQSKQLVVCQDNGKYDGETVAFTANDLDTIRHESQHVVQDCADGIGDNSLVNMFPVAPTNGQTSLSQFVSGSGLSPYTLMHIFSTYSSVGADSQVLALEFEAFAVAHAISASTIAEAVANTCPIVNNN